VIPGQGNPWRSQRERERAALEREASKLLADDRRRQRKANAPLQKSGTAMPEPMPRGWIKLADLKSALRKNGGTT
jgi:hypothetical protein